ncbi:MAG: D-alanyl-D-alanine carboxypeptidase/D-alanyl-D-alanine-endopeptidase [Acidobacteriota bacterium]|nr:D-alanyl-D-alanine carboxypeptidase/D-alanyl-D-alanine-endopeptidase [Acidobacteriota bacterium]
MMKTKQFRRRPLAAIFTLTIAACFGLIYGFSGAVSAQEKQRERVIAKPTPTVTTTKPTVSPTPTAAPTMTPTATPSPSPAIAVQTIPELQAKIRSILLRPQLQRGRVGVKIVSLDTNKVIFEENAEKYFMPASNMKNFTVSTALEKLTPEFRFVTSVYAPAMPDASGTIRGDLIIYGRGDPSISTAFNDKDYYRGMNNLAEKIVASGVRRVEGALVGDESYFSGDPLPSSWEWDDLQWYYGAEVSALTVNDNALDLVVRPGSAVGAPASVQLLPSASGVVLVNNTRTSAAGTRRDIGVRRRLGTNVVEVFGSIPLGAGAYTNYVSVPKPALVFVSMLRQLLEQKGVVITGQTRTVDAEFRRSAPLTASLVEVAKLESPPLSLIAAKTMKPSQNLYTELILRAMGESVGDKTNPRWTSADRGIAVVDKFLQEIGVAPGSVLMYDGSGLSRHDLITPEAVVQLYSYMNSRSRFAPAWRDSLTIAGVDGTLSSRFKGTRGENNVRGKTGTIDQVSSLSGYLTTAAGERLAFSVITNNLPNGSLRTGTIDEIVTLLANFNGRTN